MNKDSVKAHSCFGNIGLSKSDGHIEVPRE